MSTHKLFSLSLQKQFKKPNLPMEAEINNVLHELNVRTALNRSNIKKQKGCSTITLLYLILLLPFLKQRLSWFFSSKYVSDQIEAQKDTFYRLLNHVSYNWRKLVYFIAMRVISHGDNVPLREKTIIADDTISPKTGKNMELVSYHFDHKTKRSILGYQCLQLGYHNGVNFFPIDLSLYTSTKRPNDRVRDIDKRTNGWKRRKEALGKKTDNLIAMVSRAWSYGIDASFVLFDSWFSHDVVISKIKEIGYGVICRLKRGNVKYTYNDKKYTIKQLWKQARKQARWNSKFKVKGICLNVTLPKSGLVRIAFISAGKKQWQAFLCTDTDLDISDILEYYARRWAIEVFFKDAKQMLYLGKEQSHTFDAVVACYSIVMIRYLILVYLLNKRRLIGPLGPLFRDISDTEIALAAAKQIWKSVKEHLIESSDLVFHKLEPKIVLYILDIIEDYMFMHSKFLTAKL